MIELEERISFFEKNYSLKIMQSNLKNKSYINDNKSAERSCRFCGRSEIDTNFKKDAHAIPQLLGNKFLLSKYECDECNQYFSSLENHLGNYTSFWRSVAQIQGKKGKPKYKNADLKVESKSGKLFVQHNTGSEYFKFNEGENSFNIKGYRDSYIPIAVYKCLTKIALTLMPQDKMQYFKGTLNWILERDHTKIPSPFALKAFEHFIPGLTPHPFPEALLLIRKENAIDNVPYAVFVICYSNFMYQIYLPHCDKDNMFCNEGSSFKFVAFPSKYELAPNKSVDMRDFSGSQMVKGQEIEVTFSYDQEKELKVSHLDEIDELLRGGEGM